MHWTKNERIQAVRSVGSPIGPTPCVCDGWCEGRRYTCPGCLRFVRWCFGAADEAPELCDDCWGVLVDLCQRRVRDLSLHELCVVARFRLTGNHLADSYLVLNHVIRLYEQATGSRVEFCIYPGYEQSVGGTQYRRFLRFVEEEAGPAIAGIASMTLGAEPHALRRP